MAQDTNKPLVITIDGPAGAGKSTVARGVADAVGVPYLDTGAIYRAIAWHMLEKKIAPEQTDAIVKEMQNFSLSLKGGRVFVDGKDVSEEIRTSQIDAAVSPYAALGPVRDAILSLQRAQAQHGLVADGRDMGTVVFPDADLKIFLTATAEERATRRYKERIGKGEDVDYDEILRQVNERDKYDMNRELSPLRPASGALILDSTSMSAAEVIHAIAALAGELKSR